jgi:septal ring factor EnvC (AmiA/AmiB activator)
MTQPFFKREADQTNMERITELQQGIDRKEASIRDSRCRISNADKDLQKLKVTVAQTSDEVKNLKNSLAKMNAHIDPDTLTLDDVMQKLRQEDNSKFREVMEDLKYDGKEPLWRQLDFAEHMKTIQGDNRHDPESQHALK